MSMTGFLEKRYTMSRRLTCVTLFLVPLMVLVAGRGGRSAGSDEQATQQRKTESFWQKLLRISGISATPSTLKGPGDTVQSGQIWLAEVGSGRIRRLTGSGSFRSPVFMASGNDILALNGTDIVQLSSAGGEPKKLYTIRGSGKLIGFSRDDPDKVLLLTEDEAEHFAVGLLSVETGNVTPLPYDTASSRDREMIEYLRSGDRVYGDKSVYVKRQTKQSLSGTVQWTDVFLQVGVDEPVNVSRCDGIDCAQPSLSSDGRFVVFVKADEQ